MVMALNASTNKTDCHDITEILLKVALNTITLTRIKIFLFCKKLHTLILPLSKIIGNLEYPHTVMPLLPPLLL
jgi:hypothetical protein